MVMARELGVLIDKLAHPFPEVRTPALKSILTKIHLEILSVEDLCQEKLLFIRLLEWFNFDESPTPESVFRILKILIENPHGAESLLSIGAVDFLSNLRLNCDADFYPDIDFIMHKLLTIHDAVINPGTVAFRADKRIIEDIHKNEEPPPLGFMKADELNFHPPIPVETIPEKYENLKFTKIHFAKRPLNYSDKSVLDSAKTSLQSSDPVVVVTSCEFIGEVLLSDFPAEVILQRPVVLDCLLNLLKVKQRKTSDVHLAVIDVFSTLCQKLKHRLLCICNPGYHSATGSEPTNNANRACSSAIEDLSKTLSRVKVTRTAATDTSICSESTIDGPLKKNMEVDDGDWEDVIYEDQSVVQYSLPQFCTSLLTSFLHLYESSDIELACKVNTLTLQVIDLVQSCVDLNLLWSDKSSISKLFCRDFEVAAENLSEAIQKHRTSIAGITNSKLLASRTLIMNSQAILLSHLLQCLLSGGSKTLQISETAKLSWIETISDYPLFKFFPKVKDTLAKILDDCSQDKTVFGRLNSDEVIRLSIENLAEVAKMEVSPETVENFLKSIDRSHCALAYADNNFDLITRLVEVNSDYCDHHDSVYELCKDVLANYLRSPFPNVRIHAYKACEDFVSRCLDIETNADNVKNKFSKSLRFLLDEKILDVIIKAGLLDSTDEVKTSASSMLYQLLNSQLLFDSNDWMFFVDNVMQSFILLQSHTSKETQFGNTILNLVNEDRNSKSSPLSIPAVDKLRGCLRLMFNAELKLRIEAVGMLVWHIAKEPGGHSRLPGFSTTPLPKLHNLFYLENPIKIEPESGFRLKTQTSTLDSVLDIALSEKLDKTVKKSAFDQVAILLQDVNLHNHFIAKDGVKFVEKVVERALEKVNEHDVIHSYLPSAFAILRHLFFWQSKIRHLFSHNSRMIYNLVRSAFVLADNYGAMTDIIICLSLLLFDEILMPGTDHVFSLPKITLSHFRLPFLTDSRSDEMISSLEQVTLPSKENDPLSVKFLNHALMDFKIDSKEKVVNETEILRFEIADVKLAIGSCLNSLLNARSHKNVSSTLQELRMCIGIALNSGDSCYSEFLDELDFEISLEKFLTVAPSSFEDKSLLVEILKFIQFVLASKLKKATTWFRDLSSRKNSFLISALKSNLSKDLSGREDEIALESKFIKQLLQVFTTFEVDMENVEPSSVSSILDGVTERIKICDNSENYDLSCLLRSLECMSVLMEKVSWADSMNESSLSRIFPTLLSVLHSFSIGRSSTNLSFMGSAVSENILQCLNHLAREMSRTFKTDPVWLDHWAFPWTSSDVPFDWLATRWYHRNSSTRHLAFTLSSNLCNFSKGQEFLTVACQSKIRLSFWSFLIDVIVDRSECCDVKTQAANAMIHLTKSSSLETVEECANAIYTGPLVSDGLRTSDVSGLHALEILLENSRFFAVFAELIMHYFAFPKLRNVPEKDFGSNADNTSTMLEKFNSECARVRKSDLEYPVETWEALSTPRFLAALCSLVQNFCNLLPEFCFEVINRHAIFRSLLRLLDHKIIGQIIAGYSTSDESCRHRLKLQFKDLCCFSKFCINLLSFLCTKFPRISQNENMLVLTIASFLCIEMGKENEMATDVHEDLLPDFLTLVSQVSRSLRLCVQYNPTARLETILTTWSGNLPNFVNLANIVAANPKPQVVSSSEFFLLMTSLSCKAVIGTNSDSVSTNHAADLLDKVSGVDKKAFGEVMVTKMIPQLDFNPSDTYHKILADCLQTTLAFSESAKTAALSLGLLEEILDHVKLLHCRMTAMHLTSINSSASREENFQGQLTAAFEILRNFMFGSSDVKIAAHDNGLTPVLLKLWAWCIDDPDLLFCVLECMNVYVAKCERSAVSMVSSSNSSVSSAALSLSGRVNSSNTLVHHLIKAALKETNPATSTRTSLPLPKSIFSLLATLSLTLECRGVMWKSSFLQKFDDVTVPRKITSSSQSGSQSEEEFNLWLDLFVNVSFSQDGQQMIAKMNGSIDRLIGVVSCVTAGGVSNTSLSSSSTCQHISKSHPVYKAAVILHNISFNASNKAKLLANANFISSLSRVVSDEFIDPKLTLVTVATLWAVLYNNQKAKVAFKNALIGPIAQKRLSSVREKLNQCPEDQQMFQISCFLQTIFTNVST